MPETLIRCPRCKGLFHSLRDHFCSIPADWRSHMNRCAADVEIPPNGPCPHCGSGPHQACGKHEYRTRAEAGALLTEAQAIRRPEHP
jgi:hypothetical protein